MTAAGRAIGCDRDTLVGRSRQLAAVVQLSRPGAGRAVVLEGEPGIGKTAILRAGVAAAREQDAVRTVEANLTKVYAKLSVRSRTELASRLRQ